MKLGYLLAFGGGAIVAGVAMMLLAPKSGEEACVNFRKRMEPGSAPDQTIKTGITLQPLGHGSGMLGLPGDFTSPSRFVRATFFQTTAPVWGTGKETVVQAFHILNNFDIPIGSQHIRKEIPKGLPSATQFTSVTDQTSLKMYYRTAWNSNIRCIDLMNIDFHKVKFQSHPLDKSQEQPVEMIRVN